MIDLPVEILYNTYLENLYKCPVNLEVITVKEICNKVDIENFDKHKKYNDQNYFNDVNYQLMAEDILNVGTYWHFVTIFTNGKYEVLEGIHRAWALQLATLKDPRVFDKKILSITLSDEENLGETRELWKGEFALRKHKIKNTFEKTVNVKLLNPKKYPILVEKFNQYNDIRLDIFNDSDDFINIDTNSYKLYFFSLQQYSRILQNKIELLTREERKKLADRLIKKDKSLTITEIKNLYNVYLMNLRASSSYIKRIKLSEISKDSLNWDNKDFFKNEYLNKTDKKKLAESLFKNNSIWLFSHEKNKTGSDNKIIIRQGKHRVSSLLYLVELGLISDNTEIMSLEENVERTVEKGTYATIEKPISIAVPINYKKGTKHGDLILSKNKNFLKTFTLKPIVFGEYETDQTIWLDFFSEILSFTYIKIVESGAKDPLKTRINTIDFK
jgi:hypothetical protein